MAFQLPESLQRPDDDVPLDLLRRYYGRPYCASGSAVGAAFDS